MEFKKNHFNKFNNQNVSLSKELIIFWLIIGYCHATGWWVAIEGYDLC